jgi:hypothetical protein
VRTGRRLRRRNGFVDERRRVERRLGRELLGIRFGERVERQRKPRRIERVRER